MSLLSVNFNESHCPLSYLNAFDSSFTEVLLHLNVNLHISSITATEPKRFKYKYKARVINIKFTTFQDPFFGPKGLVTLHVT